jgi:transcriptional regulator with XRE-family HTH domain
MTESEEAAVYQGFGAGLATLRQARGLSQAAFAGKIKFSAGFVGLVETGRRRPSDKFLDRAATVLELEATSLKEARDLADTRGQVARHSKETLEQLSTWLQQRLSDEIDRNPPAEAARTRYPPSADYVVRRGDGARVYIDLKTGPGRKSRQQRLLDELFDKVDDLRATDLEKVIAYIEGLSAHSAKP